MKTKGIILDQVNGAIINSIEEEKGNILNRMIREIEINKQNNIALEQESLNKALQYVNNVREFIESPDKILGSELTKHGEIAEQVEVNIGNARDIMNRLNPKATFEGVGRTAPEDYRIDGINVQSKFINGSNNTLKHVLEHMGKYDNFTQDGGYYHVPKDQYEIMLKISQGREVEGLNLRSLEAIRSKIAEIEIQTGQNFQQVVKPSISEYGAVQQGEVVKTINKYEDDFIQESDNNQNEIRNKANEKIEDASQITAPSLKEAVKYGAIAAAMGGAISGGIAVYKKHKQGKEINEYSLEDWKDVGFEVGKGSARGGISGTSIYGLMKFANCSAPVASAIVSTSFGVVSLTNDYIKGNMEIDELIEQGQALCMESALVAIGSAVGQTLIPIPILGTIVGSFATKMLLDLTKEHFNDKEQGLIDNLKNQYDNMISRMNFECKVIMEKIQTYYDKLNGLVDAAFDFNTNYNLTFNNSIKLCEELGVREKDILHNEKEIDNYFLM